MNTPVFLEIVPKIPENLRRLADLAGNLFFSWYRPARSLFEDLDRELWRETDGNPRLLLRCVAQSALDRASTDEVYLARYHQALAQFDAYVAPVTTDRHSPLIAYFCAEYGFHESFPIYSGGLGVLAGDHCKAASDERLNFVGVGLLYRQGYFAQSVDSDGVQHARYEDHDPRDLPVEAVRDAQGHWLRVTVAIGAREVAARLWRAQVGRVTVYLLDTDCEENTAEDRDITHRLYGGDLRARIRQEIVLGIGGVRALRALGIAPDVWHINEGHAAFLIVERMRELAAKGVDVGAALEAVAASSAFTTHTPVAAGHDQFPLELLRSELAGNLRDSPLTIDFVEHLGAGPQAPGVFNMTRLALSGSRHVNGVSRVHGHVSAALCADQWPQVPPADNPVGYVTNGVHVPTFLHQTWNEFFDRHLIADWRERLSDAKAWATLERVPDADWWRASQDVKSRMICGVRERLQREFEQKGMSAFQWRQCTRHLDPDKPGVLTIGFARRFATYKRAALLLRDRARLARLLNDPERPILLLFAGKAHPADEPGKAVLREIKQLMLTPEFAGRVVFLDDYDMRLARWLVSGCDVWLNNPVAPLEASGTSGMKAAANGTLNLSILDGWWAEGCDGENGWGITPVNVQDSGRRDAIEAEILLDTLEQEVVPLYYAREAEGHSPGWVARCRHAMATVIPRFNTRRVVCDYAEGIYAPAAAHGARLAANGYEGARALAAFKARASAAWPAVTAQRLEDPPPEVQQGARVRMKIAVDLAGLAPDDLDVELIAHRRLPSASGETPALTSFGKAVREGEWRARFTPSPEQVAQGSQVYLLDVPSAGCGQYALEVVITPHHPLLSHRYELGLMKRLGEAASG